jgi:autotransporter-associated beta strand protein
LGQVSKADIFDNNGTTAGFGVTNGSSYDWLGTGLWSDTTTVNDGTAAVVSWQGTLGVSEQAYFVGSGTAGQNYTVRLGSSGGTDTYIQNLALNVVAGGGSDLSGAAGNVTIGNSGDAGKLILRASNSVGAQNGGTLTINNGVNLNAFTMNFRGGNMVINGVVSGTGASKIAFSSGAFGLSSGTLTLANTANTYAGRANTDYINANYTLAVTKLANGGSNSSIGTSSANIGINGGTLKYIGNTGAQSTNLGLHIGSAHAFIDASGVTSSDTISISGGPTYATLDSARIITLRGANLGDNTMGFAFNNNGTGANILTKTGDGRWVVNQSNGYTGGTNANGGTLVAANTGAFGVAGRTINFSTGTVEFATDTTANAYVLNFGSGTTGTVVVNRANSAASITHSMGTATIGNSTLNVQKGANVTGDGTLEFAGISLTAGIAGLGTVTLNPTTAKISVLSGGITRAGNNAASLTLDGTIAGNTIAGVIANRISDNAALSLTKSNTSTWELSVANTFSGNTKVTGGTLKLTHNLAIQNSAFDTSGAGTLDISTINTPTFGGLTSATSYVLPANVTSLTLNPASGTPTFTGDLSRTGGGAGLTLTKTGAGTQILGGTNSYTGLTTVNGGELQVTTTAAIGGTNVEVLSGRLALNGGITVSGKSLTISGNGTNFFGGLQSVSGTNEWAGSVTLGADLSRLGARKDAILVISGAIGDGANTFTAVIRNENQNNTSGAGNANTITELSGVSTYGGNTQLIAGVTRLAGGDNRLPTGTILQFGGSGANAKFDMYGRNQEVAGLAVLSANNDTQRDWNANELTNSSATLSKLTVNTAVDQSFGRTPVFTGSANYTGIITGNIELEKTGTASLTLSGTNTYTGSTTITGGTLALTGSGSIAESAIINVHSGSKFNVTGVTSSATIGASTAQTLKGLGTVEIGAKILNIGANGTLAPGASPGTLTFDAAAGGALNFASGSDIAFELGTTGSGNSDIISFSSAGDWLQGTANATLALTLLSGFDYTSTYTVFENVTTTGFTLADVTGYDKVGYTHSFAQSGNNYQLSFAPVPETSTTLLSLLGSLALLRRRRRN